MLGEVWAQGLGLGWMGLVGVQGSSRLGFSKQVAVPTLLLHPVFNHGQSACREERWQDKWCDKWTMGSKETGYTAMLFNN